MAKTVRLIGCGEYQGTEAQKARVGDYRAYNYGYICPITRIREVSPKTLEITVLENGKEYTNKVRKTTLLVLCDEKGKIITR